MLEMGLPPIETPRLLLRDWVPADRDAFVRMNADAEVMRYFPALVTAEETDAMLERNRGNIAASGIGFWAVELRETGEWLGFIGLGVPRFAAHFTPCVEMGWRLEARYWNRGLATEGAMAMLRHAREGLAIPEVVAFTAVENKPSRRVMEKIGMAYVDGGDFDHPHVPEGHALRRHVLYRTTAYRYPAGQA